MMTKAELDESRVRRRTRRRKERRTRRKKRRRRKGRRQGCIRGFRVEEHEGKMVGDGGSS